MTTETLFNDIAGFVRDSRAILARGDFVALEGLDTQVARLCEAVLDLTPDDRLRHASTLQTLLGELSALGETLESERDRIAGNIRGASSHKKASVAYRVADARDDFGKREE